MTVSVVYEGFFHEQSNDCVTTPKNERFHYRLKLAQVYIVLLFIVSKKWNRQLV